MINIMYCGNEGVFDGMLISLISIIEHTTKPLHVFVLTADLTEQNELFTPITDSQIDIIRELLKQANKNSEIDLIDVKDLYLYYLKNSPNTENSYTPYTLIRLLSDKIDVIPDKLLYLDTDTMALDDISILYDTDISTYEYGAVRDYFGKFFFGPNYINAGVLLLNMKRIRETGLFERATMECAIRKMFLSDQSAVNMHTTRRLIMKNRFNEQKRAHDDTVIRHFSMTVKWIPYFHTRNVKPWNREALEKYNYKHDLPRIEKILERYYKVKEKIANKQGVNT